MKRIVKLELIRDERREEHAKGVRAGIGRSIESIRKHLGNDVRGYALVAWNSKGAIVSSVRCGEGKPIRREILPMFVKDKLESHITEDYVIERLEEPEPGPAS